jgi:hypothetical protein
MVFSFGHKMLHRSVEVGQMAAPMGYFNRAASISDQINIE